MRYCYTLIMILLFSSIVYGQSPTETETETPTPTPTPTCGAGTTVVNTLLDHDDGCCDVTDCTLREAVTYAPPSSTITFSVSGTIYPVSNIAIVVDFLIIDGGNTITLDGNGLELSLITTATIEQIIIQNSAGNCFTVASASLTLSHISCISANDIGTTVDFGGFLIISDSNFTNGIATAIKNNGTLTITGSTFSGNNDNGANGGGAIYNQNSFATISTSSFISNTTINNGGAINSSVTSPSLIVDRCLFSGNTALSAGAVYFEGTSTISNSTFTGNIATGSGGAIRVEGTGTLINSTIANNSANDMDGGGIYQDGTFTSINSILSNNTGGNCDQYATPTDGGHNIDSGSTCGFSTSNTDPLLNTLANNGGPTQTMSLQALSPAIDAGDDTVCTTSPVSSIDQRGITRPQGTHCDIGAVEMEVSEPTPTPTPTNTPIPLGCCVCAGSGCSPTNPKCEDLQTSDNCIVGVTQCGDPSCIATYYELQYICDQGCNNNFPTSTPTPTGQPTPTPDGCCVCSGSDCPSTLYCQNLSGSNITTICGILCLSFGPNCFFVGANGPVDRCDDPTGCGGLVPTITPTDTPTPTNTPLPTDTPTTTPTPFGCCQGNSILICLIGNTCIEVDEATCVSVNNIKVCCGGSNAGTGCNTIDDCPDGTCETVTTSYTIGDLCLSGNCVSPTPTETSTETPTNTPTPSPTGTKVCRPNTPTMPH